MGLERVTKDGKENKNQDWNLPRLCLWKCELWNFPNPVPWICNTLPEDLHWTPNIPLAEKTGNYCIGFRVQNTVYFWVCNWGAEERFKQEQGLKAWLNQTGWSSGLDDNLWRPLRPQPFPLDNFERHPVSSNLGRVCLFCLVQVRATDPNGFHVPKGFPVGQDLYALWKLNEALLPAPRAEQSASRPVSPNSERSLAAYILGTPVGIFTMLLS